ncbi:hypothetical protein [Ferruginibacter profundus]
MRQLIIFALLFQTNNFCFSQDSGHQVHIVNLKEQEKLIGELGKPLGTTLTVQGIIVSNRFKRSYNDGPILKVQAIHDSSIQELIKIPLSPYFGEFGDKRLPKLENGSTYRLRVYETGEFDGIPSDAYEEAGILLQTKGFHFQNRLVVLSGEKIKPIRETPNKFIGHIALISGVATNESDTAFINTSKGKLRLIGFRKWTVSEVGKLVEVYGKIEPTESKDIFDVRDCIPRLVNLKDQIGKTVKLRGRAMNMNQYWWFNYRGTDIYVENMEELPNWTGENHFRPMEITGILEQAVLPRIDQITLKENRDKKLYYIVRKPSWTPIEKLLAVEDKETQD